MKVNWLFPLNWQSEGMVPTRKLSMHIHTAQSYTCTPHTDCRVILILTNFKTLNWKKLFLDLCHGATWLAHSDKFRLSHDIIGEEKWHQCILEPSYNFHLLLFFKLCASKEFDLPPLEDHDCIPDNLTVKTDSTKITPVEDMPSVDTLELYWNFILTFSSYVQAYFYRSWAE